MNRDQATQLISDLLKLMISRGGSDLFISADFPPAIKIDGVLVKVSPQSLLPEHTALLVRCLMSDRQTADFEQTMRAISPFPPAVWGVFGSTPLCSWARWEWCCALFPLSRPPSTRWACPAC